MQNKIDVALMWIFFLISMVAFVNCFPQHTDCEDQSLNNDISERAVDLENSLTSPNIQENGPSSWSSAGLVDQIFLEKFDEC